MGAKVKAILVVLILSLGFLHANSKVYAATCGIDQYNNNGTSVGTYCSFSCGGNTTLTQADNFTGCLGGNFCCAATTTQCNGGCLYGRKTYCSVSGGGNPVAPYGGCGAGRTCFLGSADQNCPQEPPPAGNLCGIAPDPITQTETFCSSLCGFGSVISSNSTSSCLTFENSCCARSVDVCGSCQFGRREYCAISGNGDSVAPGKNCPVGSICFLGAPDSSCPAEPPPATMCKVSPSQGKQTYCSLDCGGNPSVTYSGCYGSQLCCISTDAPPPGNGMPSQQTEFVLCNQTATPEDKGLCEGCVAKGAIWTAFGCIETTKEGVVTSLLRVGIGISGGFVLLSILYGAFLLTTSSGDPNRVKEGQEMITSAVMGLLFVIFSIIILRFIGVSILRIPGFGT